MKQNWDKIIKDFAYKCDSGYPDFTNSNHLSLLRESLLKFGWNEIITNEFIGNLRMREDSGNIDNKFIVESSGIQSASHIGDAVKFIDNHKKIYTLVSNNFYKDVESAIKHKFSRSTKIISKATKYQSSGYIFELERNKKTTIIIRYSKSPTKFNPSTINLKYEKSSESFDLGPRYIIKSHLGKKISPTTLKKAIKSGIESRKDLDRGLKDYLIDLTSGVKFGTKSIKPNLSDYIPEPSNLSLVQVGKNFGELIGAISVADNGDKIEFPDRSNEPLLDFTIYKKDGNIEKYSSKAKGTSKPNIIKTDSLINAIDKDFPDYKKGYFEPVYNWMKILKDAKRVRLAYFPLFKEFKISYDKKNEKKWEDWSSLSDEDKKALTTYWNDRKLKLLTKLKNKAFLDPLNELINGLITVDFVITTVSKSTGHVDIEVKAGSAITVSVRDKNGPSSALKPNWEAMGLDPK